MEFGQGNSGEKSGEVGGLQDGEAKLEQAKMGDPSPWTHGEGGIDMALSIWRPRSLPLAL